MRIVAPCPADRLAGLAHGLAGHGTGVDKDSVVEPGLLSLRLHHFGFICVEAAAEGNDLDAAHCASASRVSSRDQRPVEGSTLPDHSHSAGPVMTIEGGARAGLIAPDEKTFEYIKGKPRAPKGEALEQAIAYWKTLQTDEGAHYDRVVVLDAASLPPIVSWGSSPEDVISVQGIVPNPDDIPDETKRTSKWRALDYMGLKPGTKMTDITLDRVFIGSCTNGRIEDLREVAKVVEGKTVASTVDAMIVPGSGLVKEQAEAEGLDKIFKAAGFDWREPGCSMTISAKAAPL